jgi:hypothetical protein
MPQVAKPKLADSIYHQESVTGIVSYIYRAEKTE